MLFVYQKALIQAFNTSIFTTTPTNSNGYFVVKNGLKASFKDF